MLKQVEDLSDEEVVLDFKRHHYSEVKVYAERNKVRLRTSLLTMRP
jgi:hypothetical protein